MITNMTVHAEDVEVGDFLTGLDNGYVFEEPEANPDIGYGRWNSAMGGDGSVLISFHDKDGEENFLICSPETNIQIHREEQS